MTVRKMAFIGAVVSLAAISAFAGKPIGGASPDAKASTFAKATAEKMEGKAGKPLKVLAEGMAKMVK